MIIRNPRKIDEIIFIPPDSKDVRKLTSELFKFIESNIGKIDPIILAGIFHRQCVIIHPFIDGNGRNITRYFKAVGLEGDYYDLADEIDFSE